MNILKIPEDKLIAINAPWSSHAVGHVYFKMNLFEKPPRAPMFEHLEKIQTLFDDEGNFCLGKYPDPESYAISLWVEDKHKSAFELFELIVGKENDPQLYERKVENKSYPEGVANRIGFLGYKGMYVYAVLNLKFDHIEKAKLLLRKIVYSGLIETGHVAFFDVVTSCCAHLRVIDSSDEKNISAVCDLIYSKI